jgi:2,6-dihydroxypseudooxynicotine hydrolase
MAENRLIEVAGHWLPRMEVAGVPSSLARAIIDRAGAWPHWFDAWSAEAEAHAAMGEAALAEGRRLTAGEAFARAALLRHFAQFMFFDDLERKAAGQAAKVALFARAAPLLDPPSERRAIAFEGGELAAYLRQPAGARRAVAILIPGSDSTKEEFPSLEAHFLRRGVATLSLDGPGQGEGRRHGPLRPDIAAAARAAARHLRDAGLEEPVALVGMAFGGHLALRAAAGLPELAAVVSINGFFDLATIWDGFPPVYRDNMRFALGAADAEDAQARAAAFTLAGAPAPGVPALVVHGGRDRIFPPAEAEAQARWAGPEAELALLAEGNHVCNNLPFVYRPLVADWVVERTAARAATGENQLQGANP